MMQHDIIIVGGSYAGMAAILQLIRARKSVLVIDVNKRRNRSADHSYGFLGQDGVDPAEIVRIARRQLEAYPTLEWIDDQATMIDGEKDNFVVTTEKGLTHAGRRILLATGLSDQLPQIKGVAERFGRTIFLCPYCHGYELNQGRIGVIATAPMSTHQAELLTEWGEVTFLTNAAALDAGTFARLEARGVTIEQTTINRIDGEADVLLSDGRRLPFVGLFIATRCEPSSPLAATCGCALEETPMGLQVHTDANKQTSVPGIFACGDLARTPHSVSLAVGDGAWAGASLHRSLVWPDS